MATYTLKLVKREEVAADTMAFSFEKPAAFQFKAGQFIEVTLLNPPETDAKGNSREFSLASASFEANLMVATRMRDTAFKRVLKTLPIGADVQIEGPFGSFTLHTDASRPAVFLMGGIGITPVRSIILQATRDKLLHRLNLFYSNRRPEDTAFLKELTAAERENPNYRLIATMTQTQKSREVWNGETGYINKGMLARYLSDLAAPMYYLSGPPEMVTAMRTMLRDAGANDVPIRTEEFAGY